MSQHSGPLQKMINSAVEEQMSALKDTGVPVVEGSRAWKKEQRLEKKRLKQEEKEKKKLLKRFGGDVEKMNAYLEKKDELIQKNLDYKEEHQKQLANQGKGYISSDEKGTQIYQPATRGGTDPRNIKAVSREEANELAMLENMTEEEQAAYHAQKELEAQEYFSNLNRVETGEEPSMPFKAQSHMLKGRSMSFRNKK